MVSKKEGCGQHCRVSQIDDDIYVCGESLLDGHRFLCDDCLSKDIEKGIKSCGKRLNRIARKVDDCLSVTTTK